MLERVHHENCQRDHPLRIQAAKQSQVTIQSVIRCLNSFRLAVMAASRTTVALGQPFEIAIDVPGGSHTECVLTILIFIRIFAGKLKWPGVTGPAIYRLAVIKTTSVSLRNGP